MVLEDIVNGNLAVVCHDAGAANLIVYWLQGYQGEIFPCMDGPAKVIWDNKFPNIKTYSVKDAIKKSSTLLSGTGWGSSLEHQARVEARLMGVDNIAVIDHWTSFRSRFIRDGQEILPELILVSDQFARKKAERCFTDVTVKMLPNLYLESESRLASLVRDNREKTPIEHVLIISEPFRRIVIGDGRSVEFVAIDYFMSNLDKLNLSTSSIEIRLRLHPSEHKYKYNSTVNKYKNISFSENKELHDDIGWSDLVVGFQSFAMVIAMHSGVSVVSILPPGQQECVLPYPEIKSLRAM